MGLPRYSTALKPGNEKTDTCIQPADNSNDTHNNVQLVCRPTDSDRGIDHLDNEGDTLGRESGTEEDYDGGEYEDDRRDYEHEHVPRRVQQ